MRGRSPKPRHRKTGGTASDLFSLLTTLTDVHRYAKHDLDLYAQRWSAAETTIGEAIRDHRHLWRTSESRG